MATLIVTTDRKSYRVGEQARIDVSIAFDGIDSLPDVEASLRIDQRLERGWQEVSNYGSAPLRDGVAGEPTLRTWWCHPIRKGRSGTFRVTAIFFEPERTEIGSASTEFDVIQS
jgi:hypothetical protein